MSYHLSNGCPVRAAGQKCTDLLNVNLRRHTARFSAMADVSGRTGNFRRRAELAPTVSNRRSENG
jgi:hypothetical protein